MALPQLYTVAQALALPALPGQLPAEALLTKAFLADQGGQYHFIATNVRLGVGSDPGPAYPAYARRYAILSTQKRADLVALTDGAADLYEVKIQANLAGIGQLLGYRHLWNDEFPDYPVRQLGIVAQFVPLDTARVIVAQQMVFFSYPDLELPPLIPVP